MVSDQNQEKFAGHGAASFCHNSDVKKKTSGKKEDLRIFMTDFNNVRELVRLIFLFGCFTREDLTEAGVVFTVIHGKEKMTDFCFGKRKLDTEERRINVVFPKDFLIRKKNARGKYVYQINTDIYDRQDDLLMRLYRYKTFKRNEIFAYFFLLHLLKQEEDTQEEYSLRDIRDQILMEYEGETLPEGHLLGMLMASETKLTEWLYEALEKLCDAGLVLKTDRSVPEELSNQVIQNVHRSYYRLSEDQLGEIRSDEVMTQVFHLLSFMSKTSPLAAPYYFASRKVHLAMRIRESEEPVQTTLYRHNHLYAVLDNEVLYDLLGYIREKKPCCIVYKKMINIHYTSDTEYQGDTADILPLRIIQDEITGRQYLVCYMPEEKCLESLRLDQILSAEDSSTSLSEEESHTAYTLLQGMENAWTASPANLSETHTVQIEFRYRDQDRNRYRLKSEGTEGVITVVDEDTDLYTVTVTDPVEMVPWIRSFGSCARVLPSADEVVEEMRRKVIHDWEEALRSYGTI